MSSRAAIPWILLVGNALSNALSNAVAQSPPTRPSFEVASIRPAEASTDPAFLGGTKISGSSVVMRNMNLSSLLHSAFGIEARFLSGTDFLKGSQTFDIRATIPAGTSARQVPEMLQSLLEDRFKLVVHHERQERQVYALLVGKDGPKFPKSADIDESLPGGGFYRDQRRHRRRRTPPVDFAEQG